jgi:cyclopropane-fatty-acyl-phospholipid synthase
MGTPRSTVAELLTPVVRELAGEPPPVEFRFWDGSVIASPSSGTTVEVNTPTAVRRIFWRPDELGLSRAFVAGELAVDGDLYAALGLRDVIRRHKGERGARLSWRARLALLRAAIRAGVLGMPPAAPAEEVRLRGSRHSRARDARAVSHHYDISNDFYRLVLGETMTYSCAYFENQHDDLDDAQRAKYDLVCRKLGLSPGMRLLDIGCGWGGMTMHAVEHYGAQALGITLSEQQAQLARERIAAAGLSGSIEIRLQDYRDLEDGPFDAISSIGMFEHVGAARLREYFTAVRRLLHPEGRLLNHAISRPGSSARYRPAIGENTFVGRYVFPDGELLEVGEVVSAMQDAGLEVRDVESLREHYARTLRSWVTNLEGSWERAVDLVGPTRANIWRLYMAGSALEFEAARISIHQVLGVHAGDRGASGMPPTRAQMLTPSRVEEPEPGRRS